MERDFNQLKDQIRTEVLRYLVKGGADLSKRDQIQDALDNFYSEVIVDYMEKNNLELGYEFKITEDNDIQVNVWEW